MRVSKSSLRVAIGVLAALALAALTLKTVPAASRLPARLTDQEFWQLSTESSEPNGYFRSDNLTSNELLFEEVIPDLVQIGRAHV